MTNKTTILQGSLWPYISLSCCTCSHSSESQVTVAIRHPPPLADVYSVDFSEIDYLYSLSYCLSIDVYCCKNLQTSNILKGIRNIHYNHRIYDFLVQIIIDH